MAPFWIVVGCVASVITILSFLWLTWSIIRRKKDRKELKEVIREVIQEEKAKGTPIYLDGLPDVTKPRKVRLLREGFKAMKEYRHADAIAKFSECLDLETDPSPRCALFNLIGLSQKIKGDTREAEQTFLEAIRIAEQAGIQEALAMGLSNVGNVYGDLDKPQKALEYFQGSLKIREEMGDKEGKAANLGNIGIVYQKLGELQKALEYFQSSLNIHEEVGNKEGKAKDLGNIGLVYHTSEPQRALEYHRRALVIHEETNDLKGQAENLGNIGVVYFDLGQFEKALDHYKRAREKFVKIGAKHLVEKIDHNIVCVEEVMKR